MLPKHEKKYVYIQEDVFKTLKLFIHKQKTQKEEYLGEEINPQHTHHKELDKFISRFTRVGKKSTNYQNTFTKELKPAISKIVNLHVEYCENKSKKAEKIAKF
jgi:hypothetical protein